MIGWWIGLSLVIGFIGIGRSVGFWGGLIFSLLLSPLIGLIIVLISSNNLDIEFKEAFLKAQKTDNIEPDINTKLKQLKQRLDRGEITDTEYINAVGKLQS